MPKYVYDFEEGNKDMKALLGGKGANLAEMTNLGLPVPPGFTVTTEACRAYLRSGSFPPGLWEEILEHLGRLEARMGKRLGAVDDPLLVSVRSGAMYSMPGMMDTVLNLGLNDESVLGLARQSGDPRFAYDAYRRFIAMFGRIVLGVDGEKIREVQARFKGKRGLDPAPEKAEDLVAVTASDMQALCGELRVLVEEETGRPFPQDPQEQLRLAVEAVFRSWNNRRAVEYRRIYRIPDDLGTAVNVVAMVFGNLGEDSGTGVAFTRDPATGAKGVYGDYLPNAQGEDVVAGIRNPIPLSELERRNPEVYRQLLQVMEILERHYRDMCDIEFTVERGKLYMLQTRVGKRTAAAAIKIAVDMVAEGLITKEEAVQRIDPDQLDQLLHPQFDPNVEVKVLATGVNASPGAAVGKVVLDADTAAELGKRGEKVILVRWETTPDDLHGMVAAQGILTSHGGKTSHAAVVARGMGKPAVCGAEAIRIDLENRLFRVNETVVREGEVISIDGTLGRVVLGEVPLVPPKPTPELNTILSWADEIRRLGVRANADTPEDARKAREFGAEGIGLARTEHMFLGERLPIVQRMILASSEEEEAAALKELLEVQRQDFLGLFQAMDGLPVTIRLLDPPLHEFLPSSKELELEILRLEQAGADPQLVAEKKKMLRAVEGLEEANPMLGMRGCRLGIMKPGIYLMQVRAIMEAAIEHHMAGGNPVVEIMIPLVAIDEELRLLRREAEEVIEEVFREKGARIPYKIGTMIEVPRAALTAGKIAQVAEFFSFGTNDLTQTTFGFSRDDIEGKFLPRYMDRKILSDNPFETLDTEGVGRLIRIAVEEGRATRPDLKVGICGEHGGDPRSVEFLHHAGLDYVSCSPYRVPLARLAAARAVLGAREEASK